MATTQRCEGCTNSDQAAHDCDNQGRPMIHRTCPCSCTHTEGDPAPYWTQS